MPGERHGIARFPGVRSVQSATYTVSHGITPSTAVLIINPQLTNPAGFGDLVISDGVGKLPLKNAKVDRVIAESGPGGTDWTMEIVDRRWRWRDSGVINGEYNQLDPNGKLIASTIRSPVELAVLCFQQLGEQNYTIDLPNGLERRIGQGITGFLQVGELFPPTGTNPPVNWAGEVPALALQRLCEQYGRRVVYDPIDDIVRVQQLGVGRGLPDGSIATNSPSLSIPDVPSAVVVQGDFTKYQGRFLMEAVGKEWDGSWRPINALSYAPVLEAQQRIIDLIMKTGDPSPKPATIYRVLIEYTPEGTRTKKQAIIDYTLLPGDTDATLAAALAALINAHVVGSTIAVASVVSGNLRVAAKPPIIDFYLEVSILNTSPANDNSAVEIRLVQAGHKAGPNWCYAVPPIFPGVVATNRLTLIQARDLAKNHIWKTYRLSGLDVSGKGPILVPGYGKVVRKQQVHLLETKVDQVVPEAADATFLDRLGNPLIANYYDGYSRDVPAQAYGSVAKYLINALQKPGGDASNNTPIGGRIPIDFSVDPVFQTITFANYCYNATDTGKIIEPRIVLETGCHVRDPETNRFVCYTTALALPGLAPPHVVVKEDVQLNITSRYDQNDVLQGVVIAEQDALLRAQYYLDGEAIQYRLSAALTRTYNGLVEIHPDGNVQQVTWRIGSSGAETVASTNTEHEINVPPFPARRRKENLAPREADKLQPEQRIGVTSLKGIRE
jgi:hypothetical protein